MRRVLFRLDTPMHDCFKTTFFGEAFQFLHELIQILSDLLACAKYMSWEDNIFRFTYKGMRVEMTSS